MDGSTTTFGPNGTVSRNDFGSSTVWDQSGAGLTSRYWTGGFPFDPGEAAPAMPSDLPGPISLPHDPSSGSPETPSDFGLDVGGFDADSSFDSGGFDSGGFDSGGFSDGGGGGW